MSLQFHSKVFLIAGRSIQAHSPEGQDLADCPTHPTCLYLDFHLCSMTKLKEHSREICYLFLLYLTSGQVSTLIH